MACEVPVVSSNAGGIPELNVEGETGFLCNVGDVDAMAEKSIFIKFEGGEASSALRRKQVRVDNDTSVLVARADLRGMVMAGKAVLNAPFRLHAKVEGQAA